MPLGESASYTNVTVDPVACACTGTQSSTARMGAMPSPIATISKSRLSSIDDMSPISSSNMLPYPRPNT